MLVTGRGSPGTEPRTGSGFPVYCGWYPVGRVNALPVPPTLMVIRVDMLEFQPYGASPVKGLADGSGVENGSISVSVTTFDVVEVEVKVVKLSTSGRVSPGEIELSGTGKTVTADVLMTRASVTGGVLPPSQTVVPACSAKEYGP